jgi:hypothetical protein
MVLVSDEGNLIVPLASDDLIKVLISVKNFLMVLVSGEENPIAPLANEDLPALIGIIIFRREYRHGPLANEDLPVLMVIISGKDFLVILIKGTQA